MSFSQVTPVIGKQQQGFLPVVDPVAKDQVGTLMTCVDNYWGLGEFLFVAFPANAAVVLGQVMILSGFGPGLSATVAPTTANTGRPIGIAMCAIAAGQGIMYGWVQISGAAVVKAVASIAANTPFGLDAATAGSVNAVSSGRQVLNALSVAPSTTTVAKASVTTAGAVRLTAGNIDGWFPGMAISGTGIPAGTTITAVDPDQRTITMSAAATASASTTVTGVYTGYIIAMLQRSFTQGIIT